METKIHKKSLTQTWLNFSEAQSNDVVQPTIKWTNTSMSAPRPYRKRRKILDILSNAVSVEIELKIILSLEAVWASPPQQLL